MVEFGGWDMPVEYTGIVQEHMAVRTAAGLFDVSHMGEIEIAGKDALKAVQQITSNDAGRLADGQVQYSALTTPEGTFVDDVLTYRLNGEHFMLVVNASNIMKDLNWITQNVAGIGDAAVVNTGPRYALIAIQGPVALQVLQTLTGVDLSAIKYYWFTTGEVANVRVTISRTVPGRWEAGRRLNLEPALKLGDELGGHIVTGHVDGVGTVIGVFPEGESLRIGISARKELAPYLAPKGSITVDGVSLTVNEVADQADGTCHFALNIIPHTAEVTTLGALQPGDAVNLEIDVLARYLQRMQSLRG